MALLPAGDPLQVPRSQVRAQSTDLQKRAAQGKKKKEKSLFDPPNYWGGLVYPLNYETV